MINMKESKGNKPFTNAVWKEATAKQRSAVFAAMAKISSSIKQEPA